MPTIISALSALVLGLAVTPAHAIMALKQFNINPTKSEMIFTDKASTETFAGTAQGKIHEMKSADGSKTARMRVYHMKSGDYAAVEMRGHSAEQDGLYLLKATDSGTESIKISDSSIKTIEALEANVLLPAKHQGLGVGAVYGSLKQNDAKLIFVDSPGDEDSGDSDYDNEQPAEDYNRGYEEEVPRGGYYEENYQQQGGCAGAPCGNGFWYRPPRVVIVPVFPLPPPPPMIWGGGCFNRCGGAGFRPVPAPYY